MSQTVWTQVDDYIGGLLLPADPVLDAALQASAEAGLPAIQVSAAQGKLLSVLAGAVGAKTILEIGTLGGYSTIWLARALPPDGRLISLEVNPTHAEVARANLARAGVDGIAEVRLGRAIDTLPLLADEGLSFDFVFIDADKPSTPAYFEWALRLTRRGGMIITDNVIRDGKVIDADSDDPNVQGVRAFNAMLAAEPRVTSTIIQVVGSKGYDGMALALVTG
jgi:predicted O-methyltransferase YrrM